MTKHRIAILISLMFAMPAAVVALEQTAPDYPAAAEAQPAETEIATQPVAEASEPAVGTTPDSGLVRARASDTFPKGEADTEWERLPAAVAYLDRLERNRGTLVARGDAFPTGTSGDDYYQPLPAQVAYLEQRERSRVASAQPAMEAPAPVASAVPEQESSNPLKTAGNYITGLFKSDGSSTSADGTVAR